MDRTTDTTHPTQTDSTITSTNKDRTSTKLDHIIDSKTTTGTITDKTLEMKTDRATTTIGNLQDLSQIKNAHAVNNSLSFGFSIILLMSLVRELEPFC